MSAENPTLTEELNNGVLQRLADVNRQLCWGSLVARLIADSTADETALNPNAGGNDINLAAAPNCLLHGVSNAGVYTGAMALVIDPREGIAVPSGTMVWSGPGSTRLRFNATDAITDLDVWYTVPADTVSAMERNLGQQDQL
jgi:hypothetical protein